METETRAKDCHTDSKPKTLPKQSSTKDPAKPRPPPPPTASLKIPGLADVLKAKAEFERSSMSHILGNEVFMNKTLPKYFKDNYDVVSMVGKGAYGLVLKVRRKRD